MLTSQTLVLFYGGCSKRGLESEPETGHSCFRVSRYDVFFGALLFGEFSSISIRPPRPAALSAIARAAVGSSSHGVALVALRSEQKPGNVVGADTATARTAYSRQAWARA